ncbi:MAG: nucleotidyltransferase family protein [Deltaproteobacteria bacterium]|nr:nucleotidyltransferase family protein [Deltaproteobacteria bacterium]
MNEELKLKINNDRIADFCRKNKIIKLSLFGSSIRTDFGPESDVDILVEFDPEARVGLMKLTSIENELSEIIGRKVDLNTPGFISKYFRDKVLAESEVQYAAL